MEDEHESKEVEVEEDAGNDAAGGIQTETRAWQLQGEAPGGPMIITLISSFASHTAFEVWNGQERGLLSLQTRVGQLRSWRGPADNEGLMLVRNTGLLHLRDCWFSHHNIPLICAFVERWQPETNSFHMPFGEMTITLHDVHYILGLPIEGTPVVSKASKLEQVSATAKLLRMPVHELHPEWRRGGVRFTDIRVRCSEESNYPVTSKAAGYLVYLLGATLFVDKSKDRTKPAFVTLLEDLASVGQYAWGPAALAYLYRQLGIASRAGCKQLSGCITLLESWIYEYFPRFRPAQRPRFRNGHPCAQKWQPNRDKATEEKMVEYRLILDQMGVQDIVWTPFGPRVSEPLQRTLYHGNIRFNDVIEPYMPDRVLRQFGYLQIVPTDPKRPIKVNRPRNPGSYAAVYPDEDVNWNTPAAHYLDRAYYGVEAIPPTKAHEDYIEWYLARTHPRVHNPTNRKGNAKDEELPPLPNESAAFHNVAATLLPLFPEHEGLDADPDEFRDAVFQCADYIRPFIEQMSITYQPGQTRRTKRRRGDRSGEEPN